MKGSEQNSVSLGRLNELFMYISNGFFKLILMLDFE